MVTKNKNKPLSIKTLLQNNELLITKLYKKGLSTYEIGEQLKTMIDPSLEKQFELAVINDDVAILLTNSSAWATRLRYNIPTILNILNNQLNLPLIKTIKVKVKKFNVPHTTTNKNQITLSKQSKQFLQTAANSFDDPKIRTCIQRLSEQKT